MTTGIPEIWYLEAVELEGGKPTGDVIEWLGRVCERAEANYRAAMNAQSPG